MTDSYFHSINYCTVTGDCKPVITEKFKNFLFFFTLNKYDLFVDTCCPIVDLIVVFLLKDLLFNFGGNSC